MRPLPFISAGLLLLAAATGVQAQQADLRIGYINSQAILESAPGAREAQEQINRDLEGYRNEVQQMAEDLQQLIQRYEQQQVTLSAEVKAQREAEIQEKQQQYQQRVQELDQQASQRERELVQPVMDRINRVIETLREEGNYTLIFDVAAGAIIAADPDLDLTDEVIRRLEAGASQASSGGNR